MILSESEIQLKNEQMPAVKMNLIDLIFDQYKQKTKMVWL